MSNLHRIILAIALVSNGALSLGQTKPDQQKDLRMNTATGTFAVKILPPAPRPGTNDGFVHLSIDKTFQGGLQGASRVEMMATGDGTNPSGGYVALERFNGELNGKSGSFVMQHSGIMAPGMTEINVVISPGSGSGELAGIKGKLAIRLEGKQHFYTLTYELPE
jgi:hypothetical protein